MRRWLYGAVLLGAALALGCGDESPTQPTTPTPSAPGTLTVGVAGGGTPQFVALTQTKQFVATLVAADGSSQDVTNISVWLKLSTRHSRTCGNPALDPRESPLIA